MSDKRFYIDTLAGDGCICGRPKNRGRAFCYTCYKSLPVDMRQDLWQPIGNGFEDAYEAAVNQLDL